MYVHIYIIYIYIYMYVHIYILYIYVYNIEHKLFFATEVLRNLVLGCLYGACYFLLYVDSFFSSLC